MPRTCAEWKEKPGDPQRLPVAPDKHVGLSIELPLTNEEVVTILQAADRELILVGGQALAHWLRTYQVELPAPLVEFITTDVDFLGTRYEGILLQQKLGFEWESRLATMDDAGGQAAKLFRSTPEGVQQIDILTGLAGLNNSTVRKRAVAVEISPGQRLKVLHPLDVFESRLRNLDLLPSKRTTAGIAQAQASVSLMRALIEQTLQGNEREGLRVFEAVADLVFNGKLSRVGFEHALDLQRALPFEAVQSEAFKSKRWPQLLAEAQACADKYAGLVERIEKLKSRKR